MGAFVVLIATPFDRRETETRLDWSKSLGSKELEHGDALFVKPVGSFSHIC